MNYEMKHIIVENLVKGEDQATENNVAKGLSLSQSASPHDVECLTLVSFLLYNTCKHKAKGQW